MEIEENWFEKWFNTPYYHILYKDRDYDEARGFIDMLVDRLQPSRDAKFLDLACGKGRHSHYLAGKGFDVTGVDVSPNSIEEASKQEMPNLHFDVHDMREVYRENEFDFILNLFTSFGYFADHADNLRTISAVSAGLKKSGVFVLDFFNAAKVVKNLVSSETKAIQGIEFHIKRKHENGHIFKHISFDADGRHHVYVERVEAFTFHEFQEMFSDCGLTIDQAFGDYHLNPFDEKTSDRLIIIARKQHA